MVACQLHGHGLWFVALLGVGSELASERHNDRLSRQNSLPRGRRSIEDTPNSYLSRYLSVWPSSDRTAARRPPKSSSIVGRQ